MKLSIIHVVCLIITIIPLHDFIILLDLLFNVGKFALQVLTALLLFEKRWVLEEGCKPSLSYSVYYFNHKSESYYSSKKTICKKTLYFT